MSMVEVDVDVGVVVFAVPAAILASPTNGDSISRSSPIEFHLIRLDCRWMGACRPAIECRRRRRFVGSRVRVEEGETSDWSGGELFLAIGFISCCRAAPVVRPTDEQRKHLAPFSARSRKVNTAQHRCAPAAFIQVGRCIIKTLTDGRRAIEQKRFRGRMLPAGRLGAISASLRGAKQTCARSRSERARRFEPGSPGPKSSD